MSKPTNHSYQFLIEQSEKGQRLDEFFASRFGSLSRMRIANLIASGACVVNGAAGLAGYRILAGDSIEISFDDGPPTAMSPEHIPIEVIHEDEHLIVVVKPAGILVHPTMSVKAGTLANALAYHLNKRKIEDGRWTVDNLALESGESIDPRTSILDVEPVVRPGIVHRLDRATSGLMVIAKTPRALSVLSRHFRKRLVKKKYLAWVRGSVDQESGTISAPIGRDPDARPRWRVTANGKPAETRFKVLERLPYVTLLELEPVTGRTNQLRIHCAHIGHTIIGDDMHDNCGPHPAMRLCLHAWKLAFHHPASGEWMEFTAPAPDNILDNALKVIIRRDCAETLVIF